MIDGFSFAELPSIFTGGLGVGAGAYFLKWFFEWLGGRVDRREEAVERRAEQVDAGIQALIQHLQRQISDLTTELHSLADKLDACEKKHEQAQEELRALRMQLNTSKN